MLNLRALSWNNNATVTPFREYKIIADSESEGKLAVLYGSASGQPARGFATVEDAMHWAEHKHYPSDMADYLTPATLVDAVDMLVDACHGASVKGGWWHDINTGEPLKRNKLEMISLIHSELSEAVEGIRKGINDDHLPHYPMEDVEVADTLIRIFDYIGGHRLKTNHALVDKLAYNANRADHKPENRIKDGGKKY